MDKMKAAKRLMKAYRYIYYMEYVNDKKDVAKKMGIPSTSLSGALKGNEYLTENFINKFCAVFDDVNANWIRNGEGVMVDKDYTQGGTGNINIQTSDEAKADYSKANIRNIVNEDQELRIKIKYLVQQLSEKENIILELKKDKEKLQQIIDEILKNLLNKP